MIDFKDSGLFAPVTHPESGVVIHLLSRRIAPLQQGFYFTNDSMSRDGRYLWFYCAFPPSGSADHGRTLGVVDFHSGEVRHFPETQFSQASPFVDPATGEVTWGMGTGLWRRGPGKNDPVDRVNRLPAELIGARPVPSIATHLTRSADGRNFFIDAQIGLQHVFGTLPVGGGDFEEWHRFDRCHNHAQFSPVDPELVLLAQEMHDDPITGLTFPITNRLWLMRRGQAPRAVLAEPRWVSHEWWDPDGRHAWCVYGNETWSVDIRSGEIEKVVFPSPCWHSHATAGGEYVVCDSTDRFYRGCPSSVRFLNRKTGRLLKLVDNPGRTDYTGCNYHIDPHPRFCCGDEFIVFTTVVRGEVDLAMVRTEDLIDRTS